MSFLEPLLLAGLPLAALPILIHLINQRRFQTVDWGAMRFLLEANRMSRGFARIRRWMILACRTLAVAALVFVVSRPLASGWLGLAGGGAADTTLVLLDRSPSMQQRRASAAASKFETGLAQLVGALELTDSKRWVLIDSATLRPQAIASPSDLSNLSTARAVDASAHLPTLLQAAHDYISENRTGQTEVWMLSDLRSNDWDAGNSRWQSLRDSFSQFKQGVRFHLLAYPEPAEQNVGIRITQVRRETMRDGARLYLTAHLASNNDAEKKLPIRFEINGTTTEHVVEWSGSEFQLRDFMLPIDASSTQGWGRVSVPADAYPADDQFYFTFAEAAPRKTLIVSDDGQASRPLQLALSISPDPRHTNAVEVKTPKQLSAAAWEELSLVAWHAPLPESEVAAQLDAYTASGGQLLFLPPEHPTDGQFHQVSWTAWQQASEPAAVENWRSDYDLLARTQSGAALPVGGLQISRSCPPSGELTKLAWLADDTPLLARLPTTRGGVYFLATTAEPSDSSLARDGVVLYAMLQRAIEAGAAERGNTRNVVAGRSADLLDSTWRPLAGDESTLSTEYEFGSGVYAAGERLVAVNRSIDEDTADIVASERISGLFQGLDFDMVSGSVGDFAALAREVWRLFLVAMLVALLAEAALCIPKPVRPVGDAL